MNILLIAQEPPLLASQVVTGNAVRCRQLRECLEAGGHRVTHVFQNDSKERFENAFSGRD